MNRTEHNDPIAGAKALFDKASLRLDTATANRLRLMRREAQATTVRRSISAFLPVGEAAATVLAIGFSWWLPRDDAAPPAPAVAIEAAQDAYLTEEDVDVYAWLGEAPVAVEGREGKTL